MPLLVKYPTNVTTQSVLPEDDDIWVSPNNIKADDAAYASITATTFDSPDISYRLKAQGFDFSAIPDGSSINGIIVEIERYNDSGETGADYRVQLLDASGALIGDNKAKAGNWATTPTTQFYGGTEDKWGVALTSVMVKDPDFGVVLSAQATVANADIYVDYIRITVYYGSIDIGPGAINRGSTAEVMANTYFGLDNPANADGVLNTVEVWMVDQVNPLYAGTFSLSDSIGTCYDSETLGEVNSGSKQTFTNLSIAVLTGHYLGCNAPGIWSRRIERDTSGYAGVYYAVGHYIAPNDSTTYTLEDSDAISLYGTGTETEAPLIHRSRYVHILAH